jgi:hypothetical protein
VFLVDKQRTRTFTTSATQKQAAEKWAALFGCLELKKEGVFPGYAAQFLQILNGIEDEVLPFYNAACQLKLQPAKNKQTQLQAAENKQQPEQNSLPPHQYQSQKLEDHHILHKLKKKPIQDTSDELFDIRIRTKSDLQQLGDLNCVCRFCKAYLCLSSELSVDANSIWCDAKQITGQVSPANFLLFFH